MRSLCRESLVSILFLCACLSAFAQAPLPASVTVAGSLQSELGCSGDWQPACAATHLAFDATDQVWQGSFAIPAGNYEYKAALNDTWDVNYGANATLNGANLALNLSQATTVKFYYDHKTHWIADNRSKVIATAVGSFQSELACSGDWQPDCLRSWLEDPDGDGIYSFVATLPGGSYEAKVAINESWDENYGAAGVANGSNIPFTVPGTVAEMLFSYDSATHILTVSLAPPPPQPASVTVAGSLQSELGCSGDWQPACAATHLAFDATDQVWQGSFAIPAGNYEYKAALNDTWDVNYGANATLNGANLALNLSQATTVKFYYDHKTHWIADNRSKVIATAVGSFQSELACSGDWQPDCLRSWLEDPDGDGIYSFVATLPGGSYEAKVAINESWDENYGAAGVANGSNIPFTVPAPFADISFSYNPATHVLSISGAAPSVSDSDALINELIDTTNASSFYGKNASKLKAGLVAKLDDAKSKLDAGKLGDAITKLTDFRDEVSELAASDKIDPSDAQTLLALADAAIASIQSLTSAV